ncbi:hypothetical protein Airi01_101550 [Actinoallomurus iriomotensis]|uniref:Uncharacterized protein n=1 Tax=Actinoallomurus iriomotensis TaxID=478107 RepID=A0A9W6RUD2_9ACTN|nr:hypothetical protein Airi01_101550 [Actinoallomurus iriomotensis]
MEGTHRVEPTRHHSDTDLLRRIAELERSNAEKDAELATARSLLAATWPGNEVPDVPIPAELSHALRGPRQAVRLDVDGTTVIAGVRGRSTSDAAREHAIWGAVLRFARGGTRGGKG